MTYNDKTEDLLSRQIKPILGNTAKDGTGTYYFPLVDADGQLIMGAGTAALGKVGHNISGAGNGRKVVTTAGTAVALATTTAAKAVMITAETDNTNPVTWGGSGVIGALATRQGQPLYPGESSPWIPCDNLMDIYIDSLTNGEGVSFTYLT
jgi:hypothetical protein